MSYCVLNCRTSAVVFYSLSYCFGDDDDDDNDEVCVFSLSLSQILAVWFSTEEPAGTVIIGYHQLIQLI